MGLKQDAGHGTYSYRKRTKEHQRRFNQNTPSPKGLWVFFFVRLSGRSYPLLKRTLAPLFYFSRFRSIMAA